MTTDELIAYYKGLLILQYAALANAVGTIGAVIGELVQDQIIAKVRDAFDILTALGSQLDVLGTYRGISRVLFGASTASDWSLVPYADASPGSYLGWAAYADADPTWLWMQYADVNRVAHSLTDPQMRSLIQLAAAFQSSDGSLASLDDVLFDFFGTYVNVVDNEDMTITYQHQIADPDPNMLWALVVLADILPHGAGVSYTTVEV